MKTDRYTKVVLTVIAVCLVAIAFGDVLPMPSAHAGPPAQAQAQAEPMRVEIVNSAALPVVVTEFKGTAALPVRLDEIGNGSKTLPMSDLIEKNGAKYDLRVSH